MAAKGDSFEDGLNLLEAILPHLVVLNSVHPKQGQVVFLGLEEVGVVVVVDSH